MLMQLIQARGGSILHLTHTKLYIGGMTCIQCQTKIERALRRVPGVTQVSVRYQDGTAAVTYDRDRTSPAHLAAAVEALDYQVLPGPPDGAQDLGRTAGLLALIVALYLLLQRSGLLNLLVPSQLADSQMGYGMLFAVGLVTSVHCVAMCGGICLSQCLPQSTAGGAEGGGQKTMLRPALLYNLGRVASYTLTGFVLGTAGLLLGGGGGAGLPALFQGLLKLAAGAFMVVTGLNMLGIFPWLRRLAFRLPRPVAARLGEEKARENRPFFVGLLNGLMPCGPLQSMQLVALASGSPVSGALSMLAFSLGTVPLMLGLGSLVLALGRRSAHAVTEAGSVLVVVMGLAMLSQGGSLSGLLPPQRLLGLILTGCVLGFAASLPLPRPQDKAACLAAALVFLLAAGPLYDRLAAPQAPAAAQEAQAQLVDGVQVVYSTLTPGRYPSITVAAGTPVRWVIDAPAGSINGCNYRMRVPAYGLEHSFQEGENVLEFTPAETGAFSYSCWMGMIRGSIFVTDGSAAAPDGPVPAEYSIPTDALAVAVPGTDGRGAPVQEVRIALTGEGFSPAVVVVQAGLPVLWTIENEGGAASLLAPAYASILDLAPGENPLYLYPTDSFDVSTGDSRFFAYVKVVEDLARLDPDAVRAEVRAYTPTIYPPSFFESGAAGGSCCTS